MYWTYSYASKSWVLFMLTFHRMASSGHSFCTLIWPLSSAFCPRQYQQTLQSYRWPIVSSYCAEYMLKGNKPYLFIVFLTRNASSLADWYCKSFCLQKLILACFRESYFLKKCWSVHSNIKTNIVLQCLVLFTHLTCQMGAWQRQKCKVFVHLLRRFQWRT